MDVQMSIEKNEFYLIHLRIMNAVVKRIFIKAIVSQIVKCYYRYIVLNF